MKLNHVLLGPIISLIIVGCARHSTILVKPGYYQQGRYLSAENVDPYYDSLGHFYPKRTIPARYQPGRWHYAQYRSKDYADRVYPTPEDVALVASDADLP